MTVVAIRTVIVYILLIVAMRIMGKRQIGELQPAELSVALLISDVASIPIQETDIPLTHGLVPILVLVAMEVVLSVAMLKSTRIARIVAGKPMVVIQDGTVDQAALKQLRMTVDDLCESLRSQGVFNVSDVALAVVETNGNISVFQRAGSRAPTGDEWEMTDLDTAMPLLVVSDGKLCPWALKACHLTPEWVEKTLQKKHLKLSQVLMMTADRSGQYTVVEKEV